MTNKFANVVAAAVESGTDQSVAKTGGGEQHLPAAGPCNLRLVAYVELGKHKSSWQGKEKTVEQVSLTFELSGRNHPPVESDSGSFPHRITLTETLSLHEKARFFKLFQLLNYKGIAKHAAALLGEAYRGKVMHREYKGKDGKDRKVAELYDRKLGTYTLGAPRVEVTDEDGQPTGEYREVKVAPALSDMRCFIWNHADMEQWQSLFIDGEYPERKNDKGEVLAAAKSKNQFQVKISAALNYAGSPIQGLLANGGKELELPADGVVEEEAEEDEQEAPAKAPARPVAAPKPAAGVKAGAKKEKAAKADPLAGIEDADIIPF